jgi:urea transport system substrate-binding protein
MSDESNNEVTRGGLQSPFRRKLLMGMAALPAVSLLGGRPSFGAGPATSVVNTTGLAVTDTEVTVGILHSVTGTMAISETGSVQAEKLAIEQINAAGGVLGRKIKFIQEDGASDWPTFAERQVRFGDGLLDLGLAQGGAAGVRAVQRHAVLPDLL